MSAGAALDVARFSKIRALYDSTEHPAERQAAAGRMEVIARAAGMTVADALKKLDAPCRQPLPENAVSDFDDLLGSLLGAFIVEREDGRSERQKRVLAEYGSKDAVFRPCSRERALERACAPFRVRQGTLGWSSDSLWGWHAGLAGDPAPEIVRAVSQAFCMPATVREAWSEFTFWQELVDDRHAFGVGRGDPAPGVVIRTRLLERLLNSLPARSLGDIRARLSWFDFWSTYEVDQDPQDYRTVLATLRSDIERMATRISREGAPID